MAYITRREGLAAGAMAALMAATGQASAETWPELKLLVPAAPGGGWDQIARTMQQALTGERMVRSAPVTNIPGAGGIIGLAQFINGSRGDGATLMASGFVMVGAILLNKAPVTLEQVTPIARLMGEPMAFVVRAQSPIKTPQDLAAAVKADVSKVSWGGGSAGGVDHITAAIFTATAGADGSKVNYIAHAGGGESMASILGGRVTVGVGGVSEFAQHVTSGRLRFVGITAPKGTAGLPGPTFKDQNFDLEIQNWRGVFAGPGISDAQRTALETLVTEMVKSKTWREQLVARGWDDAFLVGAPFAQFVTDEMKRVSEVMRSLGLIRA
ncbi:MAG: tripartite tricarboxylate transporter substrate binding protein [Alphaproteobacteria bacterium]